MDEFKKMTPEEETRYRKRKTLLVIIAFFGILLVILTILMLALKAKDDKTFKLFVNDTQVSVSNSFIISNDGETYISLKELSGLIGYKYQNGDYGEFEETADSGYIQNNYEIASVTADSTVLKKYIRVSPTLNSSQTGITVLSENGSSETFELDKPVIKVQNLLYIPLSSLADICNSSYSVQSNMLKIYTLEFLIGQAQILAPQLDYDTISGNYENLRTLPYGMMVVAYNGNYGVVPMSTSGDASIIGTKYTDLEFIQSAKEFFVKTGDTVGIISQEGKVIINPQDYEDIDILSDDLGLYLVSEDGKYGILNREGKTIIHAEFDEIGIGEELIEEFNIKTEDLIYFPYDNLIVARKGNNYALYNIEGKEELKLSSDYTGVGCIPKNIDKSLYNGDDEKINTIDDAESVLTIDIELEDGTGIKGIVMKQYRSLIEDNRYGIYDSLTGKEIIPCACSQIYGMTENGRTKYYMEFEGEQLELVEYLESHSDIKLEKYE